MSTLKTKEAIPLPRLLDTLWQESFFSEAKQLSEVQKVLAGRGFNVHPVSLRIALVRASEPGGKLSRRRISGVFKYVQRQPPLVSSGVSNGLLTAYNLHPKIKEVSLKQFENGDYKGAIQNAFVEVIDQVKIRTGHPKKTKNDRTIELDGEELMNYIFGCDGQDPKIKFNELRTSLDRAEQRGLMNLFKGVVGIRDKKAHLNFIQRDPVKTIEYLCLASLLLRLLDEHAVKQ